MRRFWSAVAVYARKGWGFLVFVILYVGWQLAEDQLVAFVKWSAKKAGMTPTAILLFAVTNPLVAFFGAIGITLVGIFLLAWRDVRHQPATIPPEPAIAEQLMVEPPKVAQSVPNVGPVLSAMRHVTKLADAGRLREIRREGLDFFGLQLPPPNMYQAACASFRNDSRGDRLVAPAAHVRARINVGHDVYQVTGHWLLSGDDHVDLLVDAGARDLVVAVRDSEGKILLVDDRRGSGGDVEYPILHMKGITTTNYPMALILSSGGVVLDEFEYVLIVSPFGLRPAPRPATA